MVIALSQSRPTSTIFIKLGVTTAHWLQPARSQTCCDLGQFHPAPPPHSEKIHLQIHLPMDDAHHPVVKSLCR
jgi:hypothetical protein